MDYAADQYAEAANQLWGAYNTEGDENQRQCIARAQTHALLAIAGSLEALALHQTGEPSPKPVVPLV